jgi:hypothetical protein
MRLYHALLLIPVWGLGQLSDKTDNIYKKLSMSDKIESSSVGGYAGEESSVYKLYIELGENATDKEVEYIAFNGNPVARTYASYLVFSRKLPFLNKLLTHHLKNNEEIEVIEGCIVSHTFVADELYKHIFWRKEQVKRVEENIKYRDSIKALKNPDPVLLASANQRNMERTRWTEAEIDSVLVTMEKSVLADPSSSKSLVEYIAEFNYYTDRKHPEYADRLAYFEQKYHSEMIKKYLDFCRN